MKLSNFWYFGFIYTHEDSLKILDDSNNQKYDSPWGGSGTPPDARGRLTGI